MKESNMPKADFLMSILLIVFGITVLVTSINMPRFEEMDANPYSVPGVVPGFLGVIIGFMGLVLLIRSLIRKGYKLGITGQTVKNWAKEDSTRRLLLTLGLTLLYALVFIGFLPYAVGTVLFIFAFIVVFEYKNGIPLREQKRMIWKAVLTSVISGISIWVVFRYLFLVNLP
ncbi:MAG: tripartite tricarboxylate transporter TctB family protein [Spirochaetaceae bacterium]|nr:tripartite tricarboxylate transporter TctB family protein [Spirochaetaceae bacterium]